MEVKQWSKKETFSLNWYSLHYYLLSAFSCVTLRSVSLSKCVFTLLAPFSLNKKMKGDKLVQIVEVRDISHCSHFLVFCGVSIVII